jgi:hypothetical protein
MYGDVIDVINRIVEHGYWILGWLRQHFLSIVENTLDIHVLEFEQYQKWRLNGGPTNYGGCVGLPLGSVSWQRTVKYPLKLWLVVWNIFNFPYMACHPSH